MLPGVTRKESSLDFSGWFSYSQARLFTIVGCSVLHGGEQTQTRALRCPKMQTLGYLLDQRSGPLISRSRRREEAPFWPLARYCRTEKWSLLTSAATKLERGQNWKGVKPLFFRVAFIFPGTPVAHRWMLGSSWRVVHGSWIFDPQRTWHASISTGSEGRAERKRAR